MTPLFEASPCEKRALFLREKINQSLISSLLHLLEAAEAVLVPEVHQSSLQNLYSLNIEEKISSFLHALNAELLQAFTIEDIPTIQKIAYNIAENRFQIEEINFLRTYELPTYHRELFEKSAGFEIPGGATFTSSSPEGNQRIKSLFQQGLNLIAQSCDDLYKEITVFLGEIFTFESPQVKYGSSFNLFGLIYVRESLPFTPADVVDTLAHEAAHLYLFSLSADDPLVLNPPEERYIGSLRKDKRPLIGLYHGCFVISRILYALRALYSHKLLSEEDQARCAVLIEEYKVKYASLLEIIQKHAKMTTLGQSILGSTIKLAS
ncbi:hypothetical protein IM40_05775 [Candidatus Paracaedimonas acanthamoebae]|nr:hypothetical protein IM40_05775 [Candidatus Paracaedimonas acanthamoebae]